MKNLWTYPKYKLEAVMHDFNDGGIRKGWIIRKKSLPFLPWVRHRDMLHQITIYGNRDEAIDDAIHLKHGGLDLGRVRDGELIVLWLRGLMK